MMTFSKLKEQKGAVTLYVLATIILLTTLVLSLYMYNANQQVTNLETTRQIKDIYEKDVNNIEQVYQNMVNAA